MPTYSALTTVAGRQAAEALAERVEALDPPPTGVGSFEIEDGSGTWEVGAYFIDRPDSVALDLLAASAGARAFVVSEVPDIDWVAHVRRELTPVEAGRFFVYGSHDRERLPGDKVGLLIEASMAFGTGHHGTTQGCLMMFDRLLSQGVGPKRIADIGCGTAVLAMAAASTLPDAAIIATDIDEVAIDVARANLAANGLKRRVACQVAAGFDHPDIVALAPFDVIFANILKGPLIDLAPAMNRSLAGSGHAILSGLLNEQADDVGAAYEREGLTVADRLTIGEWTTLLIAKP